MGDGNVKGASSLNQKLDGLSNPQDAVHEAIAKEIRRVRNTAVMLCPVNHGELRQSIKTMVEPTRDGARGVCYTNNEHAVYVEFGTGPQGEENHNGISPDVQPTYTQQGWWIPGNDIPPQDAERYHWLKSESKEGETFYYTNGQPAQPYMYPALKMNENTIRKNLAATMKLEIKRTGGK